MKDFFFKYKKPLIIGGGIVILIGGLVGAGFFATSFVKENKVSIVADSLKVLEAVSSFLPIEQDLKAELNVLNQLVDEVTKKDNVTRSYLILLQNNMELRPGGGFLGQYAIVKIKNGEVISTFFEDANLLDQRIDVKIPAPYPFKKLIQLSKWKFRDSNFSPDFPTNAQKATYFMRLAGQASSFDGVFAVNGFVFEDILKLTGPITVPGYGTYESSDALLKLEEKVEKAYIMDPELDTQNRKQVLKVMAPIVVNKLVSLGNIPELASFAHQQMKKRNVMLYFKDERLENLVKSVYWGGEVPEEWNGDYLMVVDANMGALKTDYYMKREINYDIDLTQQRPVVTLNLTWKNTAPYGDWRTSDYHSYLRLYVPEGANLISREMVSYPNVGKEFGKTYMGFIEHTVMGTETHIKVVYDLPESIKNGNYRLLIQKQSGIGDLPVKVKIKNEKGEFEQSTTLESDLHFEFKQ